MLVLLAACMLCKFAVG